jgi:hypothetical protein
VAKITADQVHDLLTGTHAYIGAGQAAKARDRLGRLDTARQAKVGLRELSAVSGLQHSTVRAMLQHAIGPGPAGVWEQPMLVEVPDTVEPVRPIRNRGFHSASPSDPVPDSRPSLGL